MIRSWLDQLLIIYIPTLNVPFIECGTGEHFSAQDISIVLIQHSYNTDYWCDVSYTCKENGAIPSFAICRPRSCCFQSVRGTNIQQNPHRCDFFTPIPKNMCNFAVDFKAVKNDNPQSGGVYHKIKKIKLTARTSTHWMTPMSWRCRTTSRQRQKPTGSAPSNTTCATPTEAKCTAPLRCFGRSWKTA